MSGSFDPPAPILGCTKSAFPARMRWGLPAMEVILIDIADEDVVLDRRTSSKRFMLFTATDLPARSSLPFWGVMIDVGGDAVGILARLDRQTAPNGWTAHALLLAALEMARRVTPAANATPADVESHIGAAIGALQTLPDGRDQEPIEFDDSDGGLYALGTDADDGDLWLCADPADPLGEGISLEQVLIVIDQMMIDAAPIVGADTAWQECAQHTRLALIGETARVRSILAAGPVPVAGGH